jgi:hypothetical protein
MLVDSARALCPGKPVWLGPCTIGVRHNPYGAATQENPTGIRIPSATIDPRQGALFGAAYAVAAVAQATGCGVDAVTLGAPAGPFGIFNADGSPRPIRAIVAEFGLAAAATSQPLRLGVPGVHGIAWTGANGPRALVANLTPQSTSLGLPANLAKASLLQPDASWSPSAVQSGRLDLPPYRTALLSA